MRFECDHAHEPPERSRVGFTQNAHPLPLDPLEGMLFPRHLHTAQGERAEFADA